MATRVQLTFDCADPHTLAQWWARLLGYIVEDGHDFITGLLEAGVVSECDVVRIDGRLHFAEAAAIRDPDGIAPRLYFQRVPEAKEVKNRLHVDIPVPPEQLESDVTRLTQLGAALVDYANHPGHRWASCRIPTATSSASTEVGSA